jgi:hypothetical protein
MDRGMADRAAMPPDVAGAFAAFPPAVRTRLRALRSLIFRVARNTGGVGPLTETLKWGEPAYLTAATKSGSTVRLGWPKAAPDYAAVYFICHTHLVSTFRDLWPDAFRYDGDRAILLPLEGAIPDELALCLGMALTYHKR